jgi:hypothetical protein
MATVGTSSGLPPAPTAKTTGEISASAAVTWKTGALREQARHPIAMRLILTSSTTAISSGFQKSKFHVLNLATSPPAFRLRLRRGSAGDQSPAPVTGQIHSSTARVTHAPHTSRSPDICGRAQPRPLLVADGAPPGHSWPSCAQCRRARCPVSGSRRSPRRGAPSKRNFRRQAAASHTSDRCPNRPPVTSVRPSTSSLGSARPTLLSCDHLSRRNGYHPVEWPSGRGEDTHAQWLRQNSSEPPWPYRSVSDPQCLPCPVTVKQPRVDASSGHQRNVPVWRKCCGRPPARGRATSGGALTHG